MDDPLAMDGQQQTQPGARPSAEEVRRAAAAVLCPGDTEKQAIVEKYASGQELDQKEYGFIGWLKGMFRRKSGKAAEPVETGNGNAVDMEPVGETQSPVDGLDFVPIHPDVAKRITGSVIRKCEKIAARKLGAAALRYDPKTPDKEMERVTSAARMPEDDKELMLEFAPDVARELKVNPRKLAVGIYFGTFGTWAAEIVLAIGDFEKRAARREQERREEAAKQAAEKKQ